MHKQEIKLLIINLIYMIFVLIFVYNAGKMAVYKELTQSMMYKKLENIEEVENERNKI